MYSFEFDPSFFCIAITGGPCAGKSTFLARAVKLLESRGIVARVLSETATELMNSGFSPINNPSFQEDILLYQLARERQFYRMLKNDLNSKKMVLLCDRGALDGLAYSDRDSFKLFLVEIVSNLKNCDSDIEQLYI